MDCNTVYGLWLLHVHVHIHDIGWRGHVSVINFLNEVIACNIVNNYYYEITLQTYNYTWWWYIKVTYLNCLWSMHFFNNTYEVTRTAWTGFEVSYQLSYQPNLELVVILVINKAVNDRYRSIPHIWYWYMKVMHLNCGLKRRFEVCDPCGYYLCSI